MKIRLIPGILAFLLSLSFTGRADEGMWLPLLIEKYNLGHMQQLGLRLTASQIYDVNQACLKDAIVALDHGGCTGSIISSKGLLITNHHCGYDAIAGQSGLEHDYLTEGFWAMRPEEELPLPGKTVSFLVSMEDVTAAVLQGVSDTMSESNRADVIAQNIEAFTTGYKENTQVEVSVESMFEGNEYYLFIYKTYRDIRMVGAPPSSIGKFGGETDNWMWPRHTGDFCLLRVYTGPAGDPANFDRDNLPLGPRYFLPVSLAGVRENDFSMILGYPGATDRYLTSEGIRYKVADLNPADIAAKGAKLDVMKPFMDEDDATRIAYAGDYAYLANFWKKSVQESKALVRLRVFDTKKAIEDEFAEWVKADPVRSEKYGSVIPEFREIYVQKSTEKAEAALSWLYEFMTGARILYIAFQTGELSSSLGTPEQEKAVAAFREKADEFYQEFNPALEETMLRTLLLKYYKSVSSEYIPDFYLDIKKKYKGDASLFASYMFDKSIFASREKIMAFLDSPRARTLQKDLAYLAAGSMIGTYIGLTYAGEVYKDRFTAARRRYLAGLREMYPERRFYPDANSTMRLTYGSVKPYKAADALFCHYQTTLEGVMEKEDPSNREFIVPGKLKELYQARDYGRYGENGIMPVCFLTTHDITGGNSGSPVMNGKGELIGVAFDGNSESMSSDIQYDPALQRTICVDIRYVLFVVDKFAGASYLLDEMKLVE